MLRTRPTSSTLRKTLGGAALGLSLLMATSACGPDATSGLNANIASGANQLTAVSGSPQSAYNGTSFSAPVVTELTNDLGVPISDASVIYSLTDQNGHPSAAASFANGTTVVTVQTDAKGEATTPSISAATQAVGEVLVTAVAGQVATSVALQVVSYNTNIVMISGFPQSTSVNTDFGSPVVFGLTDASNQPIVGVGVAVSITDTNGNPTTLASFPGQVGSVNVVSDSSGHVTPPTISAGALPGQIVVSAVSGASAQVFLGITATPTKS